MPTIFATELRKSRMRLWSLAGATVWMAILLPSHSRWTQDWPEAALWAVVPVLYAGPVLAAGAADTARLRTENAPWGGVNTTPWRWTSAVVAHVGATVFWALFPPLLSIAVVSVVGWTALGAGMPLSGFTIIGLLETITLALCGYAVGAMFPSTMVAPALSLFATLAITTNAPSLPASDQPWFQASVRVMVLWAASASVMFVVAAFAQRRPHHDTSRRARVASGALPASLSFMTVLALIAPPFFADQLARGDSWMGLDHNSLDGRSMRTPPHDPACASTSSGTRVCVWPRESGRYLQSLTEQAARFDEVRAAMGSTGEVTVGQPGLVDERDDHSILVETHGDGDGLWLTAGPFAAWAEYASRGFAKTRCEYVRSTSAEFELAWTLHIVSTAYIFGADKPTSVRHPGSSDSSNDMVADIRSRSDREQLIWMVETNDALLSPCLEELNAER